jgi:hypothetical protein
MLGATIPTLSEEIEALRSAFVDGEASGHDVRAPLDERGIP